MLNTVVSVRSLQAKLGLPFVNQVIGWMIFGMLIPIPSLDLSECDACPALASLFPYITTAPNTAEGRLLTYFLSFCPCFVVLSIRAEGLFYLSYCTTLYLWTLVEADARPEKANYRAAANDDEYEFTWNPRRLSSDDVRIALFFLFFVQVGFFGTGK
jgi:phosphatidylinositol glycan class N